jgi:hypothetical protein
VTLPPDWLQILKAEYPARRGGNGWAYVARRIPHLIDDGYSWDEMLRGVRNYRVLCGRDGKIGTVYVQQARTHFGPDLWFTEYAAMDVRTADQKRDEAFWQDLERRARAIGFTSVDRSKGPYIAARVVEDAEKAAQAGAGIVVPDKRLRIVK